MLTKTPTILYLAFIALNNFPTFYIGRVIYDLIDQTKVVLSENFAAVFGTTRPTKVFHENVTQCADVLNILSFGFHRARSLIYNISLLLILSMTRLMQVFCS